MRLDTEKIILVAIGKLYNEQSTYLIGELKQQAKMNFNISVNAINTFVTEIEGKLDPHSKKTLELIVDAMHDGISNLKKDINSNTKQNG